MLEDTIIGILVDVSGSMRNNFQINAKVDDHDISRIQAAIKTIFEILKKEVDSNTTKKVFLLVFGLNTQNAQVCDLLGLIRFGAKINKERDIPNGKQNLNQMLKSKGVYFAGDFLDRHSTDKDCAFLYAFSRIPGNEYVVNQLIESLPSVCKNGLVRGGYAVVCGVNTVTRALFGTLSEESQMSKSEEEATKQVVANAMTVGIDTELKKLRNPKTFEISEAVSILKKALGVETTEEKVTKEKLDAIIEDIEPYIFDYTPMCQAIKSAVNLFHSNCQNKILFFMTDGEATDGDPTDFAQTLKNLNVTVIVCLLTSEHLTNPRQLYYNPEDNWSDSTKQMFDLATPVDNSHSMMSVFLERGWNLALEGESKLFIQPNHPDIISEVKDIVPTKNNDSLLNIVARASLDIYINIDISNKMPSEQEKGTCYANASATVIHLSQRRIYEREEKVTTFEYIRKDMIRDYGTEGANTEQVLKKHCEKYRLQYKKVDEEGAKIAVSQRRPVVAIFCLSISQWENFYKFYDSKKRGILKKKDLGPSIGPPGKGHAVVLMKVTPDYLLLMNSWGTEWGDDGFFKIENASVLGLEFYDVFWTENDLTSSEKAAYEEWKNSGTKLLDRIPESVKSLPYTCPKCNQSSPANNFEGNFREASCPKCYERFTPVVLGLTMFN